MGKWAPGLFYAPIKVLIGAYLFKISALRDISLIELLGIVPMLLLLAIVVCSFYRRLLQHDVSDSEKIMAFSLIIAFSLHVAIGWKVPTIHPQYMEHFLLLLFGCFMLNLSSRYGLRTSVFALLMFFNVVANVNFYSSQKSYYEPWKEIAATIDSCVVANNECDKPIIGEYTALLPIAFYGQNKSTVFYQSYSPFFPASENKYARLNVFGNVFFTDLYHFNFFPIAKRTSFIEIMESMNSGILIERRYRPIETVHLRLNDAYHGAVVFSPIKIFATNQGPIALLHWKHTNKK
jgi:hypothetical protein